MNKIIRSARICAFICLIVLASIGVGMSGGVPLPLSNNKRDAEKENTEQIDTQSEKSDFQQGQVID